MTGESDAADTRIQGINSYGIDLDFPDYSSLRTDGLTHFGLVTPYGNTDLSQHRFRWWLVAWQPQAITSPNDDLPSVKSGDIYLREQFHSECLSYSSV